MYTAVESLCCTPELNLTLYINYISVKKKKKKIGPKCQSVRAEEYDCLQLQMPRCEQSTCPTSTTISL